MEYKNRQIPMEPGGTCWTAEIPEFNRLEYYIGVERVTFELWVRQNLMNLQDENYKLCDRLEKLEKSAI